MRRLSVILNAERGDGDAIGARVRDAFQALPVEIDVAAVRGSNLKDAATKALASGSDAIVAGGGDGTISAVASVVTGTAAALGVLPLGTLNHFARDLGVPLSTPPSPCWWPATCGRWTSAM